MQVVWGGQRIGIGEQAVAIGMGEGERRGGPHQVQIVPGPVKPRFQAVDPRFSKWPSAQARVSAILCQSLAVLLSVHSMK